MNILPDKMHSSDVKTLILLSVNVTISVGRFDRMGVQPILPIKVSVSTETMLDFNGNFDGHSDGDVTRKQTLKCKAKVIQLV